MHDVCDRWPNAALKMAAAATASSPQAWEDEPVELQPGLPAELEAELELMLNTPPGSPIPVDIGVELVEECMQHEHGPWLLAGWCDPLFTKARGLLFAGKGWFDTLSAFGWTGTDERLAQLCAMLLGNEIMAWPQLALVGKPESWPGADEFLEDELDILRRLKRRGDDVPRLAHVGWRADP